ncbi:CsgG/HfaB family protein [Tellurirhabdus bombi]|uniref:CsgG/HfaB family protein n=1 Tax=Tellurirhabdus bombi TaxID=2907205 RepID=UPI001F23D90A|nr:CsgG/HfaB family protein [Tellurirhabdus bombi]
MILFLKRAVLALVSVTLVFLLEGCASYFNQPTRPQKARLGEETTITAELRKLPLPREKVVAAVYKFRDQTGQYRPSETGANWSTAVTQGATNILLKALEESNWFVPIERENVSNLLNERKIVRSSMAQYKNEAENLPPLLFAGIILEGGIVSYDANTITGGAGLRYFGAGGSAQYRQDRVSVYLRAVATKSGKILKTVYTSKTLFSQTVSAGLFRYVRFKRLMETETGYSTTEPSQMAVTEAIEKAVHAMILEGIRDNLWTVDDKQAKAAQDALTAYDEEKRLMSDTDIYGGRDVIDPSRVTIQPYASVLRYQGDYLTKGVRSGYGLLVESYLTPNFGIQLNAGVGTLASDMKFSQPISTLDANLIYRPQAFRRVTPMVFGGAGVVNFRNGDLWGLSNQRYWKLSGGAGLEYALNNVLGIRASVEYNQPLTDALDGRVFGKYYDYYWKGSVGVSLYVGRSGRRASSQKAKQAAVK